MIIAGRIQWYCSCSCQHLPVEMRCHGSSRKMPGIDLYYPCGSGDDLVAEEQRHIVGLGMDVLAGIDYDFDDYANIVADIEFDFASTHEHQMRMKTIVVCKPRSVIGSMGESEEMDVSAPAKVH